MIRVAVVLLVAVIAVGAFFFLRGGNDIIDDGPPASDETSGLPALPAPRPDPRPVPRPAYPAPPAPGQADEEAIIESLAWIVDLSLEFNRVGYCVFHGFWGYDDEGEYTIDAATGAITGGHGGHGGWDSVELIYDPQRNLMGRAVFGWESAVDIHPASEFAAHFPLYIHVLSPVRHVDFDQIERNEPADGPGPWYTMGDRHQNSRFAVAFGGEIVTDFIYDFVPAPALGSAFRNAIPARRGDKWGFIDAQGNEVIPFIFDNIATFDGDIAFVRHGGVYGILDVLGSADLPPLNLTGENAVYSAFWALRRYYVSYLNALNEQDPSLLTNITDSGAEDLAEQILAGNDSYFYFRSIAIDLDRVHHQPHGNSLALSLVIEFSFWYESRDGDFSDFSEGSNVQSILMFYDEELRDWVVLESEILSGSDAAISDNLLTVNRS